MNTVLHSTAYSLGAYGFIINMTSAKENRKRKEKKIQLKHVMPQNRLTFIKKKKIGDPRAQESRPNDFSF